MEIKRLRCFVLKKLKTVNNLNPYYIKEIFFKTTNLTPRPMDINFNQNNTTKYGNNSRGLGPTFETKEEIQYEKFKNYMVWFEMRMYHVLFSKCMHNVTFF